MSTIWGFILYCLTSTETITITNILANFAVVAGFVVVIIQLLSFKKGKKDPVFNCIVSENDLYPNILIHDKNTEPAFEGNAITAFYMWIDIFNTNKFGNIIIKSIAINGVSYFRGNLLLFTSQNVKTLETKISTLMAPLNQLGPGDAISGYFPFYGDGHINFGLGEYQLEIKPVRGKPKFTTINIKKSPDIYPDIRKLDNSQTLQAD